MSLFQATIQISREKVAQIISKNWNLELGKTIKASQNHTFQAKLHGQNTESFYSVRVTPDPHKKNIQRVHDQITFVRYLSEHNLNHICSPIKPLQADQYFFVQDDLIVCVFQWAKGELLNFVQFQWMKNKTVVNKWGQFFAELHNLSRHFEKQNPEVAKRIQRWDQIHHSILAGTQLHPDDEKILENPEHYGVLHGDLNCSNFFYQKTTEHLQVFDTDQVQRGFFLWDVSQAIFSVFMLQNAGMPIAGTPVPEANRKLFQQWIVEGYQNVAGKGSVDLQRLNRMVLLKRQFYLKFCTKAVEQGNIPADMKPFIQYIAKHLGDKKQQ